MVARPREAASSRCSGRASRVAMGLDTAYIWFSMTKAATGTVAMQMAERGLLVLNTPVRRYYEPFSHMTPHSRPRWVPSRHPVSHSAGLANPLPLRGVHLASEAGPDRRQFVRGLIDKHPGFASILSRVFSTDTMHAMRRVQVGGRKLRTGLGWYRRGRHPKLDHLEHLGGGAGFWNCMRIYPPTSSASHGLPFTTRPVRYVEAKMRTKGIPVPSGLATISRLRSITRAPGSPSGYQGHERDSRLRRRGVPAV